MSVPEPLMTTSPDRLSGTPVFAGTRVPVQTLIDYLEAGDPLEAFLNDFPSVSREHAVAVLEVAKSALLAKAVAAYNRAVRSYSYECSSTNVFSLQFLG